MGDAPLGVGGAPRRPCVAMLGMGMDGCAGGVAPLCPYDMVGRDFRCFAWGRSTAMPLVYERDAAGSPARATGILLRHYFWDDLLPVMLATKLLLRAGAPITSS